MPSPGRTGRGTPCATGYGSPGVRVPEQPTSADLTALADTLRTAALYVTEKRLTARLDAVRKYLADGASQPQASGLWRDALGRVRLPQPGIGGAKLVEEVRRIRALTGDVARLDELTRRLAGGGTHLDQPDRGLPRRRSHRRAGSHRAAGLGMAPGRHLAQRHHRR